MRGDRAGVDLDDEHLLVGARLGEHLAGGGDDLAAPAHLGAGVGPGGVALDDERLVLDRPRAPEQGPVGDAGRGPRGGHDEQLGAGVELSAVELGEAQVVAGGQPDGDGFAGAPGRRRATTISVPASSSLGSPEPNPNRWILRYAVRPPSAVTSSEVLASVRPSGPGSASRSTKDPACRVTPDLGRERRHGGGPRPVERLGRVLPAPVVEAGRGPQLGQHDEVREARLRPPLRRRVPRSGGRKGTHHRRTPARRGPATARRRRSPPGSGRCAWSVDLLGLRPESLEPLVVGPQGGVLVAVGLSVETHRLLTVPCEPLACDEDREDEGRRLAEAPRDLTGTVLVGEGVRRPRQVDLLEEVGGEHEGRAAQRDTEERVERDRGEQDDEQDRRRPPRRTGVDADEHPREEVAGEEEVGEHEQVARVRREGELEQRRPVERREAAEEEHGGDDRVREHLHGPGVDDLEDELARPPRAVVAGRQGAQGEGQRRGRDEEQRHDHGDDHVHHHVHRELHPAPDVGGAARGPDERDPAEGPQDGAVDRPRVTATDEAAHARGIQPDRDDRDRDHEPVRTPLGEPVRRRHRAGVGEARDGQHRAR